MHRPVALFLLFTTAAVAADGSTRIPAQALEQASALRDAAAKDALAYEIVSELTTEIGPRLAGSANDARALAWVQAKFKALGYDKVWTEPVKYPKWVRRSETAELVAPWPQKLAVTALGGSPGTPKGGLVAKVVGFDSLDALKTATSEQVRDKIVYVGARMHQHKDGHDYGIGSAVRTGGPILAAAKGAAAFVLRSAGTDGNRLPHTGITRFADRKIPAAAVSNPDADLIEAALKHGQPVKLKLALDCGTEGEYTGANVIGEITGSERPDEIVAIGGHLDSWDLGTGAIDDGAGVAIAMAAGAQVMKSGQRPKRTIRVVAFANEESGLFGGKAYAEAHAAELAKHVLVSESDGGAGRVWQLGASVKPEALGAIDQIMQVLAPLGVARGGNGGGGPDFSPFHAKGVAALSLRQDATHYFDWHHTANDTLDKIDRDDIAQNVAVYATWTYLAAETEGDFGSAPGAFANDKGE